MPTPLAGIGQISIRVHDIERSTAFYRDALGLDFSSRPDHSPS
jgi:catechol 2,3-dioxygenase-like lactoylglutathione lyase family enzyme